MSEASQVNVPDNFLYLRPRQVDEMTKERDGLMAQINSHDVKADKGQMRRRANELQRMLDTQQAPDLNGSERDAFAKEAKRLEEQFAPGMLSGQVMRKNPAGSVDKNLAWHRKNRFLVQRWKNIKRALGKGDRSPNVSNIETLRPHSRPTDSSMHDAQIPGTAYIGTHPSPEYKEGWDRIFGDRSPEDVAQELAELRGESEPKRAPAPKKKNLVAMACGEMKDSRGRISHEMHCKECQKVKAEGQGEGS